MIDEGTIAAAAAYFEDKLLLLADGMGTQAGRILAARRGAYLRGVLRGVCRRVAWGALTLAASHDAVA